MIDSYTPPWFLLGSLRIQMLSASAQGVEKSGVLCHIEIFARLSEVRGPGAAEKIGMHRGEVTEDPGNLLGNSMEMTQALS